MPIIDPVGRIKRKNIKLIRNDGITRKPETPEQWNNFIIELNRAFVYETGTFTPTFNGFSVDPQGPTGAVVVNWSRFGPVVFLRFGISVAGTSDDTVFEITNLPDRLKPETAQIYWLHGAEDAGSLTAEPISCSISGNTIAFGLGADNPLGGGWTGSGDKRLTNGNLSIVYSLWGAGLSAV